MDPLLSKGLPVSSGRADDVSPERARAIAIHPGGLGEGGG
jgi:hypothetical protein